MVHRIRRLLHCYYLKCVRGIVIDDSSMVGQYFDHKQFFIYYVYIQDDSLM